jgi:two-component system chemotaxis response regulator CheB
LWVADSDGIEQYICHTGHRYSRESLLDGQSQALEQALRMAIRALRERAFFCARLASRAREHGHLNLEKRFLSLKSEAEENAKTIDDLFSRPGTVDVEDSLLEGDDIGPS